MTDDEIKALLDDYPNLGPDEFRYFAGDVVIAINTLRERLRIAERERDFFRESGQRLAESVEYWQGVAADNAARANDVRGQW